MNRQLTAEGLEAELKRDDLTGAMRAYYLGALYKLQKRTIHRPLHLYFILAKRGIIPKYSGHVKIGIACNPYARVKTLQTGNPYKLKVLAVIKHAANIEGDIHKRLAHLHVRGEWFEYTEEIDELIEELYYADKY